MMQYHLWQYHLWIFFTCNTKLIEAFSGGKRIDIYVESQVMRDYIIW